MTVGEVVAALVSRGGVLSVLEGEDGERIGVEPRGLIMEAEREVLRAEKPRALALLRLLHGNLPPLEYAADVIGFADDPSADALIDQVEQLGGRLFVRRQGDIGIHKGDQVPDPLLWRLARIHVRLLEALKRRGGGSPP